MRTKKECSCDQEYFRVNGFGTYVNEVILDCPKWLYGGRKSRVSVDSCLKDEILHLWSLGISTYGCCCGHKLGIPFINVGEGDYQRMISLGYQLYYYGGEQKDRRDTFLQKTLCT